MPIQNGPNSVHELARMSNHALGKIALKFWANQVLASSDERLQEAHAIWQSDFGVVSAIRRVLEPEPYSTYSTPCEGTPLQGTFRLRRCNCRDTKQVH